MKIISLTLCIVMILSLFTGCMIKPGGAATTGEISSEITWETTKETDATEETIKKPEEKQEPQPVIENTSEAVINEIVEKEGVKGLSKRQYVQYFINNIDNLAFYRYYVLMSYKGDMAEFAEKYINENSDIIGIKKCISYNGYVVYIETAAIAYQDEPIKRVLLTLAEDDKVRHVQPAFEQKKYDDDPPTVEFELNVDDYKAVTDEISDDAIEKALKSEGLLELTKRQYIRYFSKHYKNSSFEDNEILMEYTGNMVDFVKKYITDDSYICGIKGYARPGDKYVIYLNKRSPELVLHTMMMLAEDDKVVHVQPNFLYTVD